MASRASSSRFPRLSKKTLDHAISTTLIGRPVYYAEDAIAVPGERRGERRCSSRCS